MEILAHSQKNFSLFDVYGADEAFVTGTFGGLTPVTKIDGRTIGNGDFGTFTKKLDALYESTIEKEIKNKLT
jgi:branched-chain amino acid aminotransferase